MTFKGIIPPAITPYLPDGEIDHAGLATVLEHLIASGVHGIIIGGTTGEYYAQSRDERVSLLKTAKDVVRGRVPLTFGVGAIATGDAIAYAEAARQLGADAILIGAPAYAVPTPQELAEHVLAIDRAASLPVMLYNYPGRTGTLMGAAFFDLVAHSPNIRAIKELSGDVNQLHMLATDYRRIELFCGMDDQALEFFAWGARGWVCGAGNCLPMEHLALYDACVVARDFDKGRRIMAALLPLMRVLEQGGKFVQSIKHGCALAGLPTGGVRKPILGLDEAQKHELETVIRAAKSMIAAILGEAKQPERSDALTLTA